MSVRHIQSLNDLPDEPCWAIITIDSIFVPGDERSHTAPGHGYPQHSVERKSRISTEASFKVVALSPVAVRTVVEMEL